MGVGGVVASSALVSLCVEVIVDIVDIVLFWKPNG